MARVVAVELDPDRCGMTRHNANTYGVGQRVEVVEPQHPMQFLHLTEQTHTNLLGLKLNLNMI